MLETFLNAHNKINVREGKMVLNTWKRNGFPILSKNEYFETLMTNQVFIFCISINNHSPLFYGPSMQKGRGCCLDFFQTDS